MKEKHMKTQIDKRKPAPGVPLHPALQSHKKAYDEVNVDSYETVRKHPKMARAVNDVHKKVEEQEHRETPPAPPHHEETASE
jgi:hypothetical protein